MFRSFCVRGATAVSALALCACNAVPVIQYTKINSAADAKGVADSFYFAQSQITIDKTADSEDKAKKKKTEEYSITSRPVAFEDYKVGVRPDNSARVTTKINITKIENTDLVSSIGVETTDNTASLIGQIGGAVVKIIGLVGVLGPADCIPDDAFPVKFTLTAAILASATGNSLEFGPDGKLTKGGCIKLVLGELPKDAVKAAELEYKTPTSNYYYAACRNGTVTFVNSNKPVSRKVRVADPNALQFVELPYKGSVTMHSECGVSVKTEANAPQNAAAIIDALATQGKAIKDALDAGNKK